jgi:hypothetical protein
MVIFAGQTICGATHDTVTVNEHCAVLPDASVTVCVTVVVPMGKVEPLAKPAILVVVAPGQLSVPTGAAYVTTAPAALVALTEIFAGQLITGTCVSFTVTVKLQVLVPQVLVAVIVTVVIPLLKEAPLPEPEPEPDVAPEKLYVSVGDVPVTWGV